ncbi:glycosyltransferase family 4 protein [Segnochrobactraceae bacterium EtOH-i3]
MRILFLHNNFPGQYRRLMAALSGEPGIEMVAGTLGSNQQPIPISRVNYAPHREVTRGIHPAVASFESAVLNGQAVYRAFAPLKARGWVPDVVCAHSGWGPSLMVKQLWPETKLLSYYEWYYHARGTDADFLPDATISDDDAVRTHMKNAPILMDLAAMDWGVSPTRWQQSQFPSLFRRRISVLHDGVDTDYLTPDPAARFVLEDGRVLTPADEVVTYVARGMEPYRGFPAFMAALARVQKTRPNLQALVIGQDRVAYGRKRPDGRSYKDAAIEEQDLDLSRVHFTGLVPFETLRAAFHVSTVHVYLTVPFVLSWSMIEAMAAGCLVLGSDTPPVREVIRDGENGLLTDFFDVGQIAARMEEAVEKRVAYRALREKARLTTLERYAARNLIPAHRQLLVDVASGTLPGAHEG